MATQLLIEGILDTKGSRGSGDRKFWKAWRRHWTRFSVAYPSGRREPYMVLTLSRNSSDAPEKEIKLSRDGLRLFRCRSKSRPYRTWAITSGNKVILYFAAQSEIQAQNWMQATRDGLWPPCFSFQMLTACSYEVSLVDDDNTFMAGLLGVYGRFVSSSEDVISLMHPHWGSTSLEISLDNIIDVLFIREAEISPAGVFSIILKRVEGSNVKALQFFCNTAKDAMQWILNKLYARRKSFSTNEIEREISFSLSGDTIPSQNNLYENLNNEGTMSSIDNQLVSSQTNSKNTTDPIIEINCQPEYENIRYLQTSNFQKKNKHSSFDKEINDLKANGTSEEKFLGQYRNYYFQKFSSASKNIDEKTLSDVTPNENIYENIANETNSVEKESFKIFDTTDDFNSLSSEYTNKKHSSKISDLIASKLSITPIRDEYVVYAVVNKTQDENSEELKLNNVFETDKSSHDKRVLGSNYFETFNSLEKIKNKTLNTTPDSNTSANTFAVDIKIDKSETKISESTSAMTYETKVYKSNILSDHIYGSVNKNSSNDLAIQAKSIQYSVDSSLNDHINFTKHNHHYLPNLPSNFLDTSLNSLDPKNKARGSSSSSEEDNENLLSLVNEFDELKMNDQVYEDILERKGTIYEEIDESENECADPVLNVPELPKRPTHLEIPESFRLQKLSRNITHTLQVMDDTQSQKDFRHPNFIKKIKDVNRIMRLSPNQECAKEPFDVESKLIIDTKCESLLSSNMLKT